MKKKFVEVSVILPVFNDIKFLSRAVNSILNQTFEDFELLILDDGSKENIESVISQFRDERIIYQKLKHQGLGKTLNYGIEIARGNYIARMDADDIAFPERLKRQIKLLKNEEFNLISSYYMVIDCNGKYKYSVNNNSAVNFIKKMSINNILMHSTLIFKKSVLEFFKYEENVFEDYRLWAELIFKLKYYSVPEYLMLVTKRDDSLSNKNIELKRKTVIYLSNKIINKWNFSETEKISLFGKRDLYWGNKEAFLNDKYFYYPLLIKLVLIIIPKQFFDFIRETGIKSIFREILLKPIFRKKQKFLSDTLLKENEKK